jgi:cell division protein FtsQ
VSTFTPERTRVAPIEPWIERRRDERRRAERGRSGLRRRLVRVLLVVLLGALVVAGWLVLHTSWFSARVVRVSGAPASLRAEVLEASGLERHPPLISLDPGRVSARVEAISWVGRATVQRQWPDGVTLHVTVRRPVGIVVRPGGGYAEVDGTGRVLADVPTRPPGLPLVAEASRPAPPGGPGTWLAPATRGGVHVAATLPPALSGLVTTVVVQAGGAVELQLTVPVTVDLGTVTDLRTKYEAAASVLAGGSFAPGDMLDVSLPASPVVSSGG